MTNPTREGGVLPSSDGPKVARYADAYARDTEDPFVGMEKPRLGEVFLVGGEGFEPPTRRV